jgi:hypothetical protein
VEEERPALLTAYQGRVMRGRAPVQTSGTEDGVCPEWLEAERIIAEQIYRGRKQYFVKWNVLGYAESTWEYAAALKSAKVCWKAQSILLSPSCCSTKQSSSSACVARHVCSLAR